ncbi:hypothetical protein [Paenibacillus sp. GYB003]
MAEPIADRFLRAAGLLAVIPSDRLPEIGCGRGDKGIQQQRQLRA